MVITVYGTQTSGNCHKARMVLDITGQPYAWREIDVMKAETRTPEFLRLNPNGKVPVVQLEDGSTLAESNAILWYFGDGSARACCSGCSSSSTRTSRRSRSPASSACSCSVTTTRDCPTCWCGASVP